MLEAKQTAECQKAFSDIKKLLYSSAVLTGGQPMNLNSSMSNAGKVSDEIYIYFLKHLFICSNICVSLQSKRSSTTKVPESPGSKAKDGSTSQQKFRDDSQLQRPSYEFSEETFGDENDGSNTFIHALFFCQIFLTYKSAFVTMQITMRQQITSRRCS